MQTWRWMARGGPAVLALLVGLVAGSLAGFLGLTFLVTPVPQPVASLSTAPPPPSVPVPAYGTGELMGMQSELSSNGSIEPPGVVNGLCAPSAAHPYPVVLVHGTFANADFSWQTMAPMLSDQGYCVFSLNYGATSWTAESSDHVYGVDSIENSAGELANFIENTVLPDTFEPGGGNATQVDIVGHSQGGMMPREFIENAWNCNSISGSPIDNETAAPCAGPTPDGTAGYTPGSDFVHTLVGLAPSNHGADVYGLLPVFDKLFGANTYPDTASMGCGTCQEQEEGSPFLNALNSNAANQPGYETVSGVLYYVIESALDEVVTPAPRTSDTSDITDPIDPWPSAFLHGPPGQVLNIRLQDQCPTDATEHIGIIYDPVALADVEGALANNGSSVPTSLSGFDGALSAFPASGLYCPPTLLVPPLISG